MHTSQLTHVNWFPSVLQSHVILQAQTNIIIFLFDHHHCSSDELSCVLERKANKRKTKTKAASLMPGPNSGKKSLSLLIKDHGPVTGNFISKQKL